MAGAAVRYRFHQVGAAIPFCRFLGVRLKPALVEGPPLPHPERPALAVGEPQVVFRRRRFHRRQAHDEGIQCGDVFVTHAGECGIGKGGIEMLSIAAHAAS